MKSRFVVLGVVFFISILCAKISPCQVKNDLGKSFIKSRPDLIKHSTDKNFSSLNDNIFTAEIQKLMAQGRNSKLVPDDFQNMSKSASAKGLSGTVNIATFNEKGTLFETKDLQLNKKQEPLIDPKMIKQ
jgi:hypothetical protein